MTNVRKETDSLGVVEVPADKLWGAQTQRSLEHFSIGKDLIPREMITAYAILKKAAATANHKSGRLDDERYKLIVQTCDEILAGQHHEMFPLHVWMTGSGTQFNMNVNGSGEKFSSAPVSDIDLDQPDLGLVDGLKSVLSGNLSALPGPGPFGPLFQFLPQPIRDHLQDRYWTALGS